MPSSTQLELFAIAAPSLEPCLFHELATLVPSANPVQVPGGVTLRGDLSTLYRVNLWTRLATRVLVRVGTVTALHFEELRRKTAALRWSQFVQGPVRLKVSATAHRCRLIHTGALAELEGRIDALTHEAVEAVDRAPITDDAKVALVQLVDYVAFRDT